MEVLLVCCEREKPVECAEGMLIILYLSVQLKLETSACV